MSGMNCVGSLQTTLAYLNVTSSASRAERSGDDEDSSGQTQMDAFLDQALSAAGVDEKTATAIEGEMKSLLQASKESGNFPPDPQTMKGAVDGIFSKYGLDAKKILGPPPGAGGRPTGPPPGQSNGTSLSDDDKKTLIELLQQLAQQGASADDLAAVFADAVKGLDQNA